MSNNNRALAPVDPNVFLTFDRLDDDQIIATDKRFWRKVNRSGGADACWPWMGSRRTYGLPYGQVRRNKKLLVSHRIAFELVYGPFVVHGKSWQRLLEVPA